MAPVIPSEVEESHATDTRTQPETHLLSILSRWTIFAARSASSIEIVTVFLMRNPGAESVHEAFPIVTTPASIMEVSV